MERVVRVLIERMRIRNVIWNKINNGNSYQVQFTLENGVRCDDAIHMLSEYGIGQRKVSMRSWMSSRVILQFHLTTGIVSRHCVMCTLP